jgi:hypothetical protein
MAQVIVSGRVWVEYCSIKRSALHQWQTFKLASTVEGIKNNEEATEGFFID